MIYDKIKKDLNFLNNLCIEFFQFKLIWIYYFIFFHQMSIRRFRQKTSSSLKNTIEKHLIDS